MDNLYTCLAFHAHLLLNLLRFCMLDFSPRLHACWNYSAQTAFTCRICFCYHGFIPVSAHHHHRSGLVLRFSSHASSQDPCLPPAYLLQLHLRFCSHLTYYSLIQFCTTTTITPACTHLLPHVLGCFYLPYTTACFLFVLLFYHHHGYHRYTTYTLIGSHFWFTCFMWSSPPVLVLF